jgi:hypothetical protein
MLRLDGEYRDGRMQLSGRRISREGEIRHRLTWSRIGTGKVRQLWESSADGGATWKVVFDGTYTRR